MTSISEAALQRLKLDSIKEVRDDATDFVTQYYAVHHLQSIAQSRPDLIEGEIIQAVCTILMNSRFSGKRQSLFLFRTAAETLGALMGAAEQAEGAYRALKDVLQRSSGHAHRAAAETLGSMPVSCRGPDICAEPLEKIPSVGWDDLVQASGLRDLRRPKMIGRSLVAADPAARRMLVLKFARRSDSAEDLRREALWQRQLGSKHHGCPARFEVPKPLRVKGGDVLRLTHLPNGLCCDLGLDPRRLMIAFIAHQDYYRYPNRGRRISGSAFCDVLARNARLLGYLAGCGVVHGAPIPLFHNRVQTHRRRDQGVYEWFRAGRLDRWLESCRYPNFGLSGIRDFEHFIALKGSGLTLYRLIGGHFLSLMLVAGSYFRSREPNKLGFDAQGRPVDVRELFDKELLSQIVLEVFRQYYAGFVGSDFQGSLPLDLDRLNTRMIAEMGVDQHMEEILRAVDQIEMSPEEFSAFLKQRGRCPEDIAKLNQGVEDIVVYTGPHLGAFNQPISLPELIEAVETMSALCIAGRYRREAAAGRTNCNRRSSRPPIIGF